MVQAAAAAAPQPGPTLNETLDRAAQPFGLATTAGAYAPSGPKASAARRSCGIFVFPVARYQVTVTSGATACATARLVQRQQYLDDLRVARAARRLRHQLLDRAP